jgi:hypothetical protein
MILDPQILLVWLSATVAFFVPILYLMWFKKIHQRSAFLAQILFAFAIYWASETLLSFPKPMELELFPREYQVLHFRVEHGRALYLYLLPKDGEGTPRSYSLAWSPEVSRLANSMILENARVERDGGRLLYDPSASDSDGVSADYPPPLRTQKR